MDTPIGIAFQIYISAFILCLIVTWMTGLEKEPTELLDLIFPVKRLIRFIKWLLEAIL